MTDDHELQLIKERMRLALPHLRHAIGLAQKKAGPDGVARLAVIAVKADKTGDIIAQFEAAEFFADVAKALGLPTENTAEEDLDARAEEFIGTNRLRRS